MSSGARAGLLPALALTLATFAAYAPAVRGGFVWDDDLYAANPLLAQPGGLRKILTLQTTREQYYREFPAVYATFWAERAAFGSRPEVHHLVNIGLHAANAVLAGLILAALGAPGAWFAAAVFALHPVQAESVAWITERKNVLSGFFYLLSLLAWLRYEEERSRGRWAASLGAFALSLLSKPVTCTLPVVLALLRWARGEKLDRRATAELAPFFLLALVSGLWTMKVERDVLSAVISVPWLDRVLVAGRAFWFYPYKLAVPAGLAFSYPRWTPGAAEGLCLAAALAAVAAVWGARERLGRPAVAALAFYAVTIAPLLGLVTIYTFRYTFVADHYQYLACLGVIAAGTGGAVRLLGADRRSAALGAVLLAALGVLTWRQAGIYKDSETLWRDTVAKNPSSWLGRNNLGFELARLGRADEAIVQYEEALRLKGDYAEARLNLGIALDSKGRAEEAEREYRAAIAANSGWPVAHLAPAALGANLLARGRAAEALDQYQASLRRDPGHEPARAGLERSLAALGVKLSGGGDARALNAEGERLWARGARVEALAHFEEAIRVDPACAEALNNLGAILLFQKRNADAAAYFREALRVRPGFEPARANLEKALAAPR